MYVDPTGHYVKKDKKLNDDAKSQIIALDMAYYNADTKQEKKEIKQEQEKIRQNKETYENKDTLVEIKNVNAFDKAMNKALSDGKITEKEYKKALKLIDAMYSSTSSVSNPNSNIEITTRVTNTTIGKSNISVNTSTSKASNLISTGVSISTTTHYEAYILYLPEWKDESNDALKAMASYYGIDEDDIGTASVSNKSELSNAWNSIGLTTGGNAVSAVLIDSHASAQCLGFGESRAPSMSTSDISKLENKDIDKLILFGCNAGHLDYQNTNPAASLTRKVNGGLVLASDGTVSNYLGGCDF